MYSIDPRYTVFIYTGAYMGLRFGELAGLKRQHVYLMRKKLTVAGTLVRIGHGYKYVAQTKTAQSKRTLDIPEPLVVKLGQHLERVQGEYVFPSPSGDGPLAYHNFEKRIWRPTVEKANLPGVTIHALRHSTVPLLIDQGADLFYVSRFLGHKNITTTAGTYGRLFSDAGEGFARSLGVTMEEAGRQYESEWPQDGHDDAGKVIDLERKSAEHRS